MGSEPSIAGSVPQEKGVFKGIRVSVLGLLGIRGASFVRYRQKGPILPDDRERVNRGQGLSLAT
jgi:hypothetical protein